MAIPKKIEKSFKDVVDDICTSYFQISCFSIFWGLLYSMFLPGLMKAVMFHSLKINSFCSWVGYCWVCLPRTRTETRSQTSCGKCRTTVLYHAQSMVQTMVKMYCAQREGVGLFWKWLKIIDPQKIPKIPRDPYLNGLLWGKIYRKTAYLMGKSMVSCRFSRENQSRKNIFIVGRWEINQLNTEKWRCPLK